MTWHHFDGWDWACFALGLVLAVILAAMLGLI